VPRARVILLAADGIADKEIALRCGCHPQVVSPSRSGRPRRFPPQQVAEVVAVACELPARQHRPLSRFSRIELAPARHRAGRHWRVGVDDIAQPFEWTFTRAELDALLARLTVREPHLRLAA